jgi:hypothetical protein
MTPSGPGIEDMPISDARPVPERDVAQQADEADVERIAV